MSPDTLTQEFLKQAVDLLRETFEGGLPGQGTQYLDHSSGIRATLNAVTAEQASRRPDGHPSIAAHARHMNFHLRVTSEWILGDHSKRDWNRSFEPQTVSEPEWARVKEDLEASRRELGRVLESLPPERLAEEGAAMGAIAHLAYHLGAIRQLLHRVR
ncbi:MAG TPA: DinB family protein [Candidatus Saccharimonadales bacterium]|nr:DinB family protein [Candidatus Saccharimonadales bacterium]